MKATLYEALGVPPVASDEEVRAALRRLIRKYYAKTRDGQGNVEEALRFINHASRILSDPDHRSHYDRELSVTTETDTEQRIAHFVSNVAATAQGTASQEEVVDIADEKALTLPDPAPAKNLHHPGLTERVASFGRSTMGRLALCVFFGTFIAAAILFVTPDDTVVVAKNVLVLLTFTLLLLTLVYGTVHGLAWMRQRRVAPAAGSMIPQTDLAILNWRREKSVFLGTDTPQEDASWIFQLRMAELERAKAGRTSEPRPWNRLAARLFDYAIWGLVLALLLSALHGGGLVSDDTAFWIGHPLFAPIVITLSWVPIEALLIASLQQTPGKWLFGVYLQFSISDAYARRDLRAQLQRALRRAFRVWWEGIACGFPLLSPILIAVAYEKIAQNGETDWDFAEDCLVTHSPPGILNMMTGGAGLAAMLWLYGVAWHEPMAESIAATKSAVVSWVPMTPSLLTRGFQGDVGKISSLERSIAAAVSPAAAGYTGSVNDADTTALFADRQARLSLLRGEGPRMLRAGNWRRAAELCRAWTELEFWNAEPWRCLGFALQAQGYHQEAINAFRKAAQHDPLDHSLDSAIDKSQRGIVADFLNRYRR